MRVLGETIGFMFQVKECIEDRLKMPAGKLKIKSFGKTFQVDICSIHELKKLLAGFLVYIPCRNRNRADTLPFTSLCDINCVFHKNYRIVISISYASASELLSALGNCLRKCLICQDVCFPRLANIPILAELTRKITSGCSK